MKPFYFQEEAIQSVFDFFNEGNGGNPIIGLPTGTGKSLVVAELMKRTLMQWPQQRIMMLTHRKELISQNHEKITTVWPTAPAGIFSASHGKRQANLNLTFGGIATLVRNLGKFNQYNCPDYLIIDECHLLSPNSETMYQKVINHFRAIKPWFWVLGLTATPYRLKQGMLNEGENSIFTHFCYNLTDYKSFNRLIDENFLIPLTSKPTDTKYDLTSVATTGGEYNQKQLQATLDREELTRQCLTEIVETGWDRKHWIIFGSGIQHCEHIQEMLQNEFKIPTAIVHSKRKDRDENIANFKVGNVRCLVNNDVLTTGFDFPGIDLIGVLTGTKSPNKWVQLLGRGTRPIWLPGHDIHTFEGRQASIQESGKTNCLVLDFGANIERLGPINDPVKPKAPGKRRNGDQGAPIKVCGNIECLEYVHASLPNCPECGYEFPINTNLTNHASDGELIKRDKPEEPPKVERFTPTTIGYDFHCKKGGTPSLKVTYICGLMRFKEWVPIGHPTAYGLGIKWWQKACVDPAKPAPATVDEALKRKDELRTPEYISVWVNKKHPEITNHGYPEREPTIDGSID
jgi:DNA repair protein RadD